MTAIVFQQFIEEFDCSIRSGVRNVVLLLDNAPSHIASAELTSVKVVMLPPNTKSHIQPMDAGINFKVHYKRNLVKQYISQVDDKEFFDRLDLKPAIDVKDSWNTATPNTIINWFRHVKIIPTLHRPEAEVTEEHLQADFDTMNLQLLLFAAEFLDVDATEETEGDRR